VRRRVAFSKAGPTGQHECVLTEFVAEFGDLKVAHT
jgi:hypothetical protein